MTVAWAFVDAENVRPDGDHGLAKALLVPMVCFKYGLRVDAKAGRRNPGIGSRVLWQLLEKKRRVVVFPCARLLAESLDSGSRLAT